jgi:hypothetical protein
MKNILSDKSFKLSIILTLLFLASGFLFLYFDIVQFSWVLFVLLPIVLGISIGALPSKKWAIYGAGLALIIFLVLLVIGQLEGMLCVLMAIPILLPFIFLGSIIMHLIRRYKEIKPTERLSILLLPIIPFLIAAPLETAVTDDNKMIIEVKTEKIFPYSTMEVYDAIKSVDTLIANKTFLMKIDLPIPTKCVLEKEEIGGLRTCYFSGGTITERITELEKGKVLKMDVIDYQLTGREWLGFKEAIYLFEKVGDGSCKLTRITTYTSELRPRFYWEPLEKIGIEQEHDYVFENLGNDLKVSTTK